MRIPIDTDTLARTALRSWETSAASATTAARRLSTGTRIESAVDDAAGLAIAERMRAQYEGLYQASRNAQEGVNFLQVAESALAHTGDMLQRIRVLAVQSANGTYSDAQREALQTVVERTLDEIDAVARRTTYNGSALLDGSRTEWTLQVGADAGDTFTVNLDAATADALGLDGTMGERAIAKLRFAQAALDLGPLSIATQQKAVTAIDIVDRALAYVLTERADHGAAVNRLEFMMRTLGVTAENVGAARSRITEADIPAETARLMRSQIAVEASASMMAQAQRTQALVLELLRPLTIPETTSEDATGGDGSSTNSSSSSSSNTSTASTASTASSGPGRSTASGSSVAVGPWPGSTSSAGGASGWASTSSQRHAGTGVA